MKIIIQIHGTTNNTGYKICHGQKRHKITAFETLALVFIKLPIRHKDERISNDANDEDSDCKRRRLSVSFGNKCI
jgi:hypothetical protein